LRFIHERLLSSIYSVQDRAELVLHQSGEIVNLNESQAAKYIAFRHRDECEFIARPDAHPLPHFLRQDHLTPLVDRNDRLHLAAAFAPGPGA
jgi:hypothetical protein